jgi:C-terminal binding protein
MKAASVIILYPEDSYPDQSVEREVYGPDATLIVRDVVDLMDLPQEDFDTAEGLCVFRRMVPAPVIARFKKLRVIVRMGVGYDRVDRIAAAAHNITVCNVPDYGTMEVADHAMSLVLALRRGIILHHDLQRGPTPAPWEANRSPLLQRLSKQTFGIIGMGRIATAVALRAKAFGFDVVFYDPYRLNGSELALGIRRVASLDALMAQSDVLSLHIPLSPETTNIIGARELALLPQNAIVVNTARGPSIDIDALYDALKSGHLAGVGLDVVPVEPPVEPVSRLMQAYRDREDWLVGRCVITPHSAFYTPHAWDDIRRKSAETMAAAFTNTPQNVIDPKSY